MHMPHFAQYDITTTHSNSHVTLLLATSAGLDLIGSRLLPLAAPFSPRTVQGRVIYGVAPAESRVTRLCSGASFSVTEFSCHTSQTVTDKPQDYLIVHITLSKLRHLPPKKSCACLNSRLGPSIHQSARFTPLPAASDAPAGLLPAAASKPLWFATFCRVAGFFRV